MNLSNTMEFICGKEQNGYLVVSGLPEASLLTSWARRPPPAQTVGPHAHHPAVGPASPHLALALPPCRTCTMYDTSNFTSLHYCTVYISSTLNSTCSKMYL